MGGGSRGEAMPRPYDKELETLETSHQLFTNYQSNSMHDFHLDLRLTFSGQFTCNLH